MFSFTNIFLNVSDQQVDASGRDCWRSWVPCPWRVGFVMSSRIPSVLA